MIFRTVKTKEIWGITLTDILAQFQAPGFLVQGLVISAFLGSTTNPHYILIIFLWSFCVWIVHYLYRLFTCSYTNNTPSFSTGQ